MSQEYHPAQEWYLDRALLRERENKILRMLIAGLLLSLLFSITSMLFLATKSKVEPFLALMDKRTGEVTTPARLSASILNEQWAAIRHFIGQYVNARESYNYLNLNRPYMDVLAMSDSAVAKQYEKSIRPELNPQSPIALYKREFYQTVKIHSITKLDQPHLVDVRFTTELLHAQDDRVEKRQEFRVILRYGFDKRAKSMQDWDKNPLGFQVTHYDRQAIEQ